ncbi:MAG: polysaccharide biosynthesis protein, partial [Proteobacteria bacterium]|nr:polysaccharide biosynthesis protein [Pseudomonadota bacterium]
PRAHVKEVGMRPGEKLHEVLVTADEAVATREHAGHYVVAGRGEPEGGKEREREFVYASDTNTQWLGVDRLRELVDADSDTRE